MSKPIFINPQFPKFEFSEKKMIIPMFPKIIYSQKTIIMAK
jgi:hypothetical protein